MSRPTTCEWCGEKLTPEERQYPLKKGRRNEYICCDCEHKHYEFTCCKCEDYERNKYKHRFVVVFEPTPMDSCKDAEPGIYEVVECPYFGGPIIGGLSLFERSLRRTPAVVNWKNFEGYPCGHLCRDCCRKLHLRQSVKGRKLHEKDGDDE